MGRPHYKPNDFQLFMRSGGWLAGESHFVSKGIPFNLERQSLRELLRHRRETDQRTAARLAASTARRSEMRPIRFSLPPAD